MLPQEAEWATKVKSIEIPPMKNFWIETYGRRPFGFYYRRTVRWFVVQ